MKASPSAISGRPRPGQRVERCRGGHVVIHLRLLVREQQRHRVRNVPDWKSGLQRHEIRLRGLHVRPRRDARTSRTAWLAEETRFAARTTGGATVREGAAKADFVWL